MTYIFTSNFPLHHVNLKYMHAAEFGVPFTPENNLRFGFENFSIPGLIDCMIHTEFTQVCTAYEFSKVEGGSSSSKTPFVNLIRISVRMSKDDYMFLSHYSTTKLNHDTQSPYQHKYISAHITEPEDFFVFNGKEHGQNHIRLHEIIGQKGLQPT